MSLSYPISLPRVVRARDVDPSVLLLVIVLAVLEQALLMVELFPQILRRLHLQFQGIVQILLRFLLLGVQSA